MVLYTISDMLVIGHRGARGLAPENTKAGFEAALAHNVDAIEFDVRTTKDNVAVLCHDDCIRAGKDKLPVANTDYISLQQAQPSLLTLSEALDFLDNRLPIVIELKPECDISPVLRDIEHGLRSGWHDTHINLSSFDTNLLHKIKRVLPDLTYVVNERWSGVRALRRARRLDTMHITMNQRWLWRGFIASMARRGYVLSAYTVNTPSKARRWEGAGLTAVVTDFPDRYR